MCLQMPAEAERIESQAAELPVGDRNGTPDRQLLSRPRSASLVVAEEETCPQLDRLEAEVVVMEGFDAEKTSVFTRIYTQGKTYRVDSYSILVRVGQAKPYLMRSRPRG